MAFDQNSSPKDLRPVNVARINAEETRISNPGRTPEGVYANPPRSDITSPPSVPVYLIPATSDTKIVGLSSGFPGPILAPAQSVSMWGTRSPIRIGTPVASLSPSSTSPSGYVQSPSYSTRVGSSSSTDQASEDGGEDSVSGKKVKLLCSFGGKILPRPSDGMLRYVGGQTRIITVRKDVSFDKLVEKMVDTYGQPVVMKYQLPDEDLDALVSVSCPDDLENMMEEYEKSLERTADGSVKLRVFLFSPSELDSSGIMQFGDLQDSGKKYVDAVNGVMEVGGGITRKESSASATSTSDLSVADAVDGSLLAQDITGPPPTTVLSPRSDTTVINDAVSKLGCIDANLTIQTEPSGAPLVGHLAAGPSQITSSQPETLMERSVPFSVQKPTATKFPAPPSPYLQGFVDPHQDNVSSTEYQNVPSELIYANPTPVVAAPKPLILQPQFHENAPTVVPQQFIPAVHMTMAPPSSNLSINPSMFSTLTQSQQLVALPTDQGYNAYQAQVSGGLAGYGWNQILSKQEHVPISESQMPHQQVILTENVQHKEDCSMCQKQLPHAHSDSVVQEQRDGSSAKFPDVNTIYHTLHLGDLAKFNPVNKAAVPSQEEAVVVSQNVEAQHEVERIASDLSRMLVPQGLMGLTGEVQTPYGMTTGNAVQSHPGDAAESLLPLLSCGKQEVLVSKPVTYENAAVGAPLIAKETLSREAAKVYSTNIVASREDTAGCNISHDGVKPIDALIEPLQIHHPEILSGIEQNRSPVDQPVNDNMFYQQSQQIAAKDQLASNPFSKPVVIPQGNVILAMASPNDIETIFANKNVPSSMAASNISGNTLESTNSLFSDQDPWNFLQESHLPPPMPNKIAPKKEACAQRDPFLGLESNTLALVVDPNDQPLSHINDDQNSEQVLPNKVSSDDLIEQELKTTVEGVAASVLQPSPTSNADVSASDANHERDLQNDSDAVIQAKLEGMNLKPEKANLAPPRSDGLGHLQIIKNSDLEELRELGSGTFGTVYHGKWRGTDVAIKRINDRCFAGKPSEQERMRNDFWNEAIKLADLHHPNVVAFYGVVLDGPGGSVATVTEYMVNGSLRTALQKNERTLDKRKRMLIAMDVAFGMEYLHSKNIVHFDLKSDNLLVNLRDPHRPICKVGDLGLSKVKRQTLISGGVRGTLPWMAPELLNGSSSLVSEKVDVFSFGIVMWELLTGEEPYADLHYGAIIGGIVSNTLRPDVPDNCDPDWQSLMERCWAAEPLERPSFIEIADELRSMAAKIPRKGQATTSATRPNA